MTGHFVVDVDPDGTRRAADRLRSCGDSLGRVGGRALATPGDMGHGWTGQAATTVTTDMGTIGRLLTGYHDTVHRGAAALERLAAAYDEALADVATLNHRWRGALEDHAGAVRLAAAAPTPGGQEVTEAARDLARRQDHLTESFADACDAARAATERAAGELADAMPVDLGPLATGHTAADAIRALVRARLTGGTVGPVVDAHPGLALLHGHDMVGLARSAATDITAFAGSDRDEALDRSTLDALRDHADDPVFATALLSGVGPEVAARLPQVLADRYGVADHDQQDALRQSNREVFTRLGTALATASSSGGIDGAWVDDYLAVAGESSYVYTTESLRLAMDADPSLVVSGALPTRLFHAVVGAGDPPVPGSLHTDPVGHAMIRDYVYGVGPADEGPFGSGYQGTRVAQDQLGVALRALATDPASAQAAFAMPRIEGERPELTADLRWVLDTSDLYSGSTWAAVHDGGAALGQALAAAATASGTPAERVASAVVMTALVDHVGSNSIDLPDAAAVPLAQTLTFWADATLWNIAEDRSVLGVWEDLPGVPGRQVAEAEFSQGDLLHYMQETLTSEGAVQAYSGQLTAHAHSDFVDLSTSGSPDGKIILDRFAMLYGTSQARVGMTHNHVLLDAARTADEQAASRRALAEFAVGVALELPFVKSAEEAISGTISSPIVSQAVGDVVGEAHDGVAGLVIDTAGPEGRAVDDATELAQDRMADLHGAGQVQLTVWSLETGLITPLAGYDSQGLLVPGPHGGVVLDRASPAATPDAVKNLFTYNVVGPSDLETKYTLGYGRYREWPTE